MATFEVYRSADGWRWRLKSGNGQVLAHCGHTNDHKAGSRNQIAAVIRAVAAEPQIVDLTGE